MTSTGHTLTLLVPALLRAFPEAAPAIMPGRRLNATAALLGRARQAHFAEGGLERLLLHLFSVSPGPQGDLPVAAIARLGEGGDGEGGYWFRADPVHLHPDRDQLLLFDNSALAVQPEEAQALVDSFNAFFTADGFHLEARHPTRWYLRLTDPPAIRTTPLSEAAGRPVDAFLPAGPDATRWHAVLNEVQMLFHGHAVNAAREAQGRPAINSLWLWGGGYLPEPIPRPAMAVYTNEAVGRGLARWAGAESFELPDGFDQWRAQVHGASSLVVINSLLEAAQASDWAAWRDAADALENRWMKPLLRGLQQGIVDCLELIPGDGSVHRITRWRAWLWWKRRRLA